MHWVVTLVRHPSRLPFAFIALAFVAVRPTLLFYPLSPKVPFYVLQACNAFHQVPKLILVRIAIRRRSLTSVLSLSLALTTCAAILEVLPLFLFAEIAYHIVVNERNIFEERRYRR